MDPLQHRQDVYEEVVEFSGSLEYLPEECECGDAEAHLQWRRRCCHGHASGSRHGPGSEACGERIARRHIPRGGDGKRRAG